MHFAVSRRAWLPHFIRRAPNHPGVSRILQQSMQLMHFSACGICGACRIERSGTDTSKVFLVSLFRKTRGRLSQANGLEQNLDVFFTGSVDTCCDYFIFSLLVDDQRLVESLGDDAGPPNYFNTCSHLKRLYDSLVELPLIKRISFSGEKGAGRARGELPSYGIWRRLSGRATKGRDLSPAAATIWEPCLMESHRWVLSNRSSEH